MNLNDIKKIYFVGIGGIGMSALARYFNGNGVEVHGYDRTRTKLTDTLEEEGMLIHYVEDLDAIPADIDLVVYTPAIPADHKELVYFRNEGLPVKKRAEVLGIISKSKKVAAVAGTHGKTTTSSMLAHLLTACNVPSTAFLGGIAQNFGSNFILGTNDWVVVEADEYDRSFLHLFPAIACIMSMDADHLDIYGDQESLHETGFQAFAKQVKGNIWVQHNWNNVLSTFSNAHSFGLEKGDIQAQNVRVEGGYFVFDYKSDEVLLEGLQLPLPGYHNVENATAAITLALAIGADPLLIPQALKSFKGVWRRFDFKIRKSEVVFVDDYAHHPSELGAAISAAKAFFPGKKITGIFQPHLFSRTRDFVDGFAESLDELDDILLLDIYPARELPIEGVTSEIIIEKMKNPNKQLLSKMAVLDWLRDNKVEVVLTLGAGDIDKMVPQIEELLLEKFASSHNYG